MAKAQYFIKVEKEVTKKQFLKLKQQEIEKDYIQKSSLLDRKIFTRNQIEVLVSEKVLIPKKYKNRIYFNKDEVTNGIKYISEPPKLFN